MAKQLAPFLLIPASLLVLSVAGAGSSSGQAIDEPVPIPEEERLQITLSLLERYPELASSSGVKVAAASTGRPGTTVTNVIFYPHAENHGIKEAFQAWCRRELPSESWTCNDVSIRRYVSLPSQSFEVRVKGDITSDGALAIIEASRRDLRATMITASDVPNTAIIISPHKNGDYRVSWGTPEGYTKLTMLAELGEGGDPVNPDHWHATIMKPAE